MCLYTREHACYAHCELGWCSGHTSTHGIHMCPLSVAHVLALCCSCARSLLHMCPLSVTLPAVIFSWTLFNPFLYHMLPHLLWRLMSYSGSWRVLCALCGARSWCTSMCTLPTQASDEEHIDGLRPQEAAWAVVRNHGNRSSIQCTYALW